MFNFIIHWNFKFKPVKKVQIPKHINKCKYNCVISFKNIIAVYFFLFLYCVVKLVYVLYCVFSTAGKVFFPWTRACIIFFFILYTCEICRNACFLNLIRELMKNVLWFQAMFSLGYWPEFFCFLCVCSFLNSSWLVIGVDDPKNILF